jgi:methyl-accepting chemotaxis protein
VKKGLSISAKMSAAFVTLLAIMAGIGFFAVVKIGEVNTLSAEMRSRWLPASQLIGDVHAYTSQYRIQQSVHVAATDLAQKQKAGKLMHTAEQAIAGMLNDYKPLLATKEQKALFNDLQTQWTQYTALTGRMTALSESNDSAAKDIFEGEALDGFYSIEDSILQLIDMNTKGANALSVKSGQIYDQARNLLIAAAALGFVVAVGLAGWLMTIVARPVKRMSAAVEQLVDGNLAVEIPALSRSDELGSLARALDSFKALFAADKERAAADLERARETEGTIKAIGGGLSALAKGDLAYRVNENVTGPLAKLHTDFNEAVTHLAQALSQIISGCNIINDGTNEIAQASNDLSLRTEKQAAALGETARTLGDFSQSVKVAADSANETSSRLAVARSSAEKVDETAKRAVDAMRNIESSSKEMTDIISTIDGLAFQTNLLALNAGVEAARAGSAGAGFAVVANEVRHLAQRSAEAASSIRQLVATSGALIGEGVSLVENSGDALRQIVTEVTEISDLVDEIADAASKQANGITEISSMVTSMDHATQQNAAMVEESTASSRNLSNETQRLFEQLSFFNLGGNSNHMSPARTIPASTTPTLTKRPASPSASKLEPKNAPSEPLPARKAMAAPKSQPMVTHGNLAMKPSEDDWSEF